MAKKNNKVSSKKNSVPKKNSKTKSITTKVPKKSDISNIKKDAGKNTKVNNKIQNKAPIEKTKSSKPNSKSKKVPQSRYQKIQKKINDEKKKINTSINKKRKDILENKALKKEEQAKIREELLERKNTVINFESKFNSTNLKILFPLLGVLLITIVLVFLFNNDKKSEIKFKTININQYLELYKKKDISYVYIKARDCTYCTLTEPYIDKLQKDYKLVINELDYDKLDEKERQNLKNSNSVFDEEWEAPILISVKDGKEVSSVKGYKEYSVFKKFVEYSNNPEESNSFIKLTIDKYKSVLNSNELSVIYIGRKKSNGCKIYTPILESVSNEKNIKVYYLDTDSLDTESDWNILKSSNDIFKGEWFMPATLIVKKGEIIDYKFESMDKDTLKYFFERNEV